MDIVFIIDGICTLVDVIIFDSTHANYISLVFFFLWNDCDNCNLGKGYVIFQLTLFIPIVVKTIWMFT